MTTTGAWYATPVLWLDGHGKKAWIAAMVLSFIFFWPVGLVILFYMIGTNRMSGSFFCSRSSNRSARRSRHSTGNTAFDAYRDDTLARLEDEQTAFNDFLARLRDAKDKTEFDAFMSDRASQVDEDEKEKEVA